MAFELCRESYATNIDRPLAADKTGNTVMGRGPCTRLFCYIDNTMRRNLLNWCNLVSISKKFRFYVFGVVRIY